MALPEVPKGTQIKLLAADYDQIINKNGEIVRRPLSDTPVRVSYVLRRDKEEVISRDCEIIVPGGKKSVEGANAKPQVIPELLSWHGAVGQLALPQQVLVYGVDGYVPELVRELNEILPQGYRAEQTDNAEAAAIVIGATKMGDKESYRFSVNENRVYISSAGKKGRYWGTRTLLQLLVQSPTALPCGTAWDAPRYQLRGFMLDVGHLPVITEQTRIARSCMKTG